MRRSASALLSSVATGDRHSGQLRFISPTIHLSKHSLWNTWQHASLRTLSPSPSPSRHTTQLPEAGPAVAGGEDEGACELHTNGRLEARWSASTASPARPDPTAAEGEEEEEEEGSDWWWWWWDSPRPTTVCMRQKKR